MLIDPNRLARQEQGAQIWKSFDGVGTLEYPTGLGKTFVAVNIIMKRMQEIDAKRTFLIVVPRIELKVQWEGILSANKIKNAEVRVINGLVLNQVNLKVTLLVLDEIHRYAANEFKKVFDLVSYKYILGLTATMERLDGKEILIEQHCPVVDSITTEEARKNGWIAEYTEYALSVKLTPEEQKEYDNVNQTFFYYYSRFDQDFDLAMKCIKSTIARDNYANKRGWMSNMGDGHPWSPHNIGKYAIQFMRVMNKRKTFLYTLESKADIVEQLCKKFPVKTIVFSESTIFADDIAQRMPEEAVAYHSNLKTTTAAVLRKGKMVSKKIGKTVKKKEAIKRIKDNRYKTRIISTAKALDEGFDVPDIEMAIIASYTSNPTQKIQRRGRAARKFKFKDGSDKKPIIIYLYVEGTQEEKWLKNALKASPVIYADNISEISDEEEQGGYAFIASKSDSGSSNS